MAFRGRVSGSTKGERRDAVEKEIPIPPFRLGLELLRGENPRPERLSLSCSGLGVFGTSLKPHPTRVTVHVPTPPPTPLQAACPKLPKSQGWRSERDWCVTADKDGRPRDLKLSAVPDYSRFYQLIRSHYGGRQ